MVDLHTTIKTALDAAVNFCQPEFTVTYKKMTITVNTMVAEQLRKNHDVDLVHELTEAFLLEEASALAKQFDIGEDIDIFHLKKLIEFVRKEAENEFIDVLEESINNMRKEK